MRKVVLALILTCCIGLKSFAQFGDFPGVPCEPEMGDECDEETTVPLDSGVYVLIGGTLLLSVFYLRNTKNQVDSEQKC